MARFQSHDDYEKSFRKNVSPTDHTCRCPRCGVKMSIWMGIEDEYGNVYCVGCASTIGTGRFRINPNDDGYDFDDEPGAF